MIVGMCVAYSFEIWGSYGSMRTTNSYGRARRGWIKSIAVNPFSVEKIAILPHLAGDSYSATRAPITYSGSKWAKMRRQVPAFAMWRQCFRFFFLLLFFHIKCAAIKLMTIENINRFQFDGLMSCVVSISASAAIYMIANSELDFSSGLSLRRTAMERHSIQFCWRNRFSLWHNAPTNTSPSPVITTQLIQIGSQWMLG